MKFNSGTLMCILSMHVKKKQHVIISWTLCYSVFEHRGIAEDLPFPSKKDNWQRGIHELVPQSHSASGPGRMQEKYDGVHRPRGNGERRPQESGFYSSKR